VADDAVFDSFSSSRQHQSYDNCLKVRMENNQNCSVCCVVYTTVYGHRCRLLSRKSLVGGCKLYAGGSHGEAKVPPNPTIGYLKSIVSYLGGVRGIANNDFKNNDFNMHYGCQ